jgi:polysaccharide export outer membrane protein
MIFPSLSNEFHEQKHMRSSSLIMLSATVFLGACSTLPSSGPTGPQIRKAAVADTALGLTIVEVTNGAAIPQPLPPESSILMDRPPPPTDMVGLGDVLGVVIYEAGVTLFAGPSAAAGAASSAGGSLDTGARAQNLPELRVDDDGNIMVPYAGKLHVVGKTVGEIQAEIGKALRGFSQNPQVIVTRREVISNAVIVGGEVSKPGRLVLNTNQETLSDVVALAGGYKGRATDLALRVKRNGRNVQLRLNSLLENPALDVRAYPGDRLTLISDPLSFSVLGAAGRIDQISFATSKMTLAQAVATAGGASSAAGDPAAIFVFRYIDDPTQPGTRKPVVYHINMMNTGSYFLAQNFQMRDKDILYFGNARANQPSKLVQLISQLFSPILTVTSAVSVIQSR